MSHPECLEEFSRFHFPPWDSERSFHHLTRGVLFPHPTPTAERWLEAKKVTLLWVTRAEREPF